MTTQISKTSTLYQLYEQDYFRWLNETAKLLRSGKLEQLDVENLAEEIEAMSRSEKRALESNLEIVLMHLLKYQYQPELRSNSWRSTLLEHRDRLDISFQDSPSLRVHFTETFEKSYAKARKKAAVETGLTIDTFPVESPFTQEQALNFDYLPE